MGTRISDTVIVCGSATDSLALLIAGGSILDIHASSATSTAETTFSSGMLATAASRVNAFASRFSGNTDGFSLGNNQGVTALITGGQLIGGALCQSANTCLCAGVINADQTTPTVLNTACQ